MRTTLLFLLAACGSDPTDLRCGPDRGLVVATTDFTVGALAMVAEGSLEDQLATVNGDPIVRSSGGALFQANRTTADTLRRYEPGDLCRPLWEVALGRGSNVHDIEWIGDAVWASHYDDGTVTRHDPQTGRELGTVDLGELADADGNPDLHDLIAHQGRLWVGAQHFDRSVLPWVSTSGVVAELDLADGAVVQRWEVGPSPRVYAHPSDASQLILLTGAYGQADGGLSVFDPDTGVAALVVDEADLGQDIEGFAGVGDHGVVWASDYDLNEGEGALYCIDLTDFTLIPGPAGAGWYVDAVAGDGVVWIGVRRGWANQAEPGVFPLDPVTCKQSADLLATALEPYSLSYVSQG